MLVSASATAVEIEGTAATFYAAMLGAFVGGAISWIFHALEGRRTRTAASVAAAHDVMSELDSIVPIKSNADGSYWIQAVDRKQLRKSLFVYAAVQGRRRRKALKKEISRLYEALENLPSGLAIGGVYWDPDSGKKLILSLGAYRDSLINVFAAIPDIRVAAVIKRLDALREEFTREQAAILEEEEKTNGGGTRT